MADDLTSKIQQSAASPKKATADGVSVEQHSIADQIAADKHVASKAATRRRGLGLKLNKISPGGTI